MSQPKASATSLLATLPGPTSRKWPLGERFVEAFTHDDMLTELYAPYGVDPQTCHDRNELYFIISGTGYLRCDANRHAFAPGDAFFVPAKMPHRFEDFTSDFMTWVVFWGHPDAKAKTDGGR
jgi:mannose-6-phosphate isomerase-like protein (cupin superfamily)